MQNDVEHSLLVDIYKWLKFLMNAILQESCISHIFYQDSEGNRTSDIAALLIELVTSQHCLASVWRQTKRQTSNSLDIHPPRLQYPVAIYFPFIRSHISCLQSPNLDHILSAVCHFAFLSPFNGWEHMYSMIPVLFWWQRYTLYTSIPNFSNP